MDKRKLVNIILKDLDEVKTLAEEAAESENDSMLVIELALNRARLLCQEIELLREMTAKTMPVEQETDEIPYDSDEVDEHNYSDPELEIINFEDREPEEEDELAPENDEDFEEEEDEEPEEEDKELEDLEPAVEEEDELAVSTKEYQEEEPSFIIEDEDEDEEDWTEEEEEELVLEEEDEEEEIVEQPATNIQSTELKAEPQPGIREIHIDEMDDEYDIEPIRFSPTTGANARPPMREIPKPEDVITNSEDKKLVGDKYQEKRSINDSIGEHKAMDSKLANSPIPSLKAAIGLNDRFLFIREIFNNNSAKYNEVIDRLDQMEQIQEAVEFLKASLSMQKNEASMKFVELLKRRFTK